MEVLPAYRHPGECVGVATSDQGGTDRVNGREPGGVATGLPSHTPVGADMANTGSSTPIWKRCSKACPCPICEHADWCKLSEDGGWAVCRRVERPDARTKIDKSGGEYYLYQLKSDADPAAADGPPEHAQSPQHGRADDDALDTAYRAMLGTLTLDIDHRQQLHNRGFRGPEIDKAAYRSFPRSLDGKTKAVAAVLQAVGRDANRFVKIPGFFVQDVAGKSKGWLNGAEGIVIPVTNLTTQIPALQIRLDAPIGDTKYIWFSSPSTGAGAGSHVHVPPVRKGHLRRRVRVTEGAPHPSERSLSGL